MPEKRLPGQSNADYGRSDPNGPYTYLGAHEGGSDTSGVAELISRFIDWVKGRSARRRS